LTMVTSLKFNVNSFMNILKSDIVFATFVVLLLLSVLLYGRVGSAYMIIGLVSFIFVPGYYVTSLVRQKIDVDVIGFSLIFGIAIQIVNLGIYYVLSVFWSLPFDVVLLASTGLSVVILKLLALKTKVRTDFAEVKLLFHKSLTNPVTYIFLIAFLVRFYAISFNSTSILPDASMYLDSARTLFSKGIFSSNIINDESFPSNPYLTTNGLFEHAFMASIFSIFFYISNVSLSSALVATAFLSSLIVYPVYGLTQKFFGKPSAIIASILITFNPLFIYFSSILFGPEIIGLLFLLLGIYILIEGADKKSPFLLLLAGLLIGIVYEIWWAYVFFILPLLPVILILFLDNTQLLKKKIINLLIYAVVIFLYAFGLKVYSLSFIFLPVIAIEAILLLVSFKINFRQGFYSSSLVVGMIIPSLLKVTRHYLIPIQVTPTLVEVGNRGLLPSIFNAFTYFFKSSTLNGFIDYGKYFEFHVTSLLLILFVISILIGAKWKEKFVLGSILFIHLLLVSLMPPPAYPQSLYSIGRFYLLPAALLTVGGSVFLYHVFKKVSSSSLQIHNVQSKPIIKKDRLLSVLCILLLVGLFSTYFIPQYVSRTNALSDDNVFKKYGWSPTMFTWIEENASQATFLSSRAREFAWFTNQHVANIMYPNMSLDKIGYTQIISLSDQFNASYILTDQYFYWNFPNLRDLCTMNSMGTVYIPKNVLLSLISNETSINRAFELVYSDNSNSYTKIWKIIEPSAIDLEIKYNESNLNGLSAGNQGKIDSASGTLTIGDKKDYTYTYRKTPLNLTLSQNNPSFFLWNVSGYENVEVKRIELWSNNGTHALDLLPPTINGVWITYLNIQDVDDLRIVISGTSGGYLATSQLMFGTFSLK
jgi:hypothetical protein